MSLNVQADKKINKDVENKNTQLSYKTAKAHYMFRNLKINIQIVYWLKNKLYSMLNVLNWLKINVLHFRHIKYKAVSRRKYITLNAYVWK